MSNTSLTIHLDGIHTLVGYVYMDGIHTLVGYMYSREQLKAEESCNTTKSSCTYRFWVGCGLHWYSS